MATTKIGTVTIGDEICEILQSDRTGKFAVCAPNQMTPNFYDTQEQAIEKARFIAGEAYNLARRAATSGVSIDALINGRI